VVTGCTAIMYAFAPVSLGSLHLRDGDRARPYRMPAPKILLPVSFVSANLILYWGGFEFTWKIACALLVGLILFGIGSQVAQTNALGMLRSAAWIGPWIIGSVIIGALGQYGDGSHQVLGEWWDLAVVIAFSLVIYYWALNLAMSHDKVQEAIAKDSAQIDYVTLDV
jgi:amino acid transporter